MLLGDCLTLAGLAATITGPGVWNATAGTFVATLPSKGTCGGGGTGADLARVKLTCNACGTLRITCSATGYTDSRITGSAIAVGATTILSLVSPGGGGFIGWCPTGPMVGTNTGTVAVNCGTEITLQLGRDDRTNMGEIVATFTVEVLP